MTIFKCNDNEKFNFRAVVWEKWVRCQFLLTSIYSKPPLFNGKLIQNGGWAQWYSLFATVMPGDYAAPSPKILNCWCRIYCIIQIIFLLKSVHWTKSEKKYQAPLLITCQNFPLWHLQKLMKQHPIPYRFSIPFLQPLEASSLYLQASVFT